MKKFNFNSILARLFLSFLLVTTPIIASGIAMFWWEKQTIQSQIETSADKNISFLQNALESETTNIKTLQYNLSSDDNLIKLITNSYSEQRDYYNLIQNVMQRLTIMKNSNNYIEDVIVYFPNLGYTVSSNQYSKMDESEYNKLYNECVNAKYPLITNAAGVYTMSLYPILTAKNETPLYMVKVVMSQDKLNDFFGRYNFYNGSETAYYDYSSNNWMAGSQNRHISNKDIENSLKENSGKKSIRTTAKINGTNYYIVSAYSKYLNSSFVQCIPFEDLFSVPNKYGIFLWFYAILSIFIILIYSRTTYKQVTYPVNALLKAFNLVEKGNFTVHLQQKAASEFQSLFYGFNKMVIQLNELIDRVYRQELYAKKSELKQLQSQINPHFLYNTYYMLNRLIKFRELENAELLSDYLGTYLEYITRNAMDEVSLQNELDHARSYAQIQQMRFSRWLSLEFGEIPDNYRLFQVPRLILQPILENSFEHGLKSTDKNGLLRVTFEDIGNGLSVIVEDNGEFLEDETIQELQKKIRSTDESIETTGIINVHRRIFLKFGPGSGITVSRSSLGGLKVEIRIIPEDEKR